MTSKTISKLTDLQTFRLFCLSLYTSLYHHNIVQHHNFHNILTLYSIIYYHSCVWISWDFLTCTCTIINLLYDMIMGKTYSGVGTLCLSSLLSPTYRVHNPHFSRELFDQISDYKKSRCGLIEGNTFKSCQYCSPCVD